MRPSRGLGPTLALVLASAPVLADEPRHVASTQDPAKTGGAPPLDERPPQPETPARTRLPPAPPTEPVPWQRHIDIGGDLAIVTRATSEDGAGNPSQVDYEPAVGFGIHARWAVFRYLWVGAYFVNANHSVDLPPGSLGLNADLYVDDVHTFAFGARLAPTLPLGERARAWISGGIGWGRLELGRMHVNEPGKPEFVVRERADAFVEFPLGIGASFELIPRWLSVDLEVTGAFVDNQDGDALGDFQAIDSDGKKRNIGGFPGIDATFVQTVGVSLLL